MPLCGVFAQELSTVPGSADGLVSSQCGDAAHRSGQDAHTPKGFPSWCSERPRSPYECITLIRARSKLFIYLPTQAHDNPWKRFNVLERSAEVHDAEAQREFIAQHRLGEKCLSALLHMT